MSSKISKDEVLSDDILALVNAGKFFYQNCSERELDEVVTQLENIREDEEDKRGISFLTYIHEDNILQSARLARKREIKQQLVGVECGLCYDPVLECNC